MSRKVSFHQDVRSRSESSASAQRESKKSEEDNDPTIQKTSVGNHGRQGLSSEEAEKLYEEVGLNELKHITVSAWTLFALQFTGLMPYILGICCIIALAVQSYSDFGVIFAILLANAVVGYHEEIKAKRCLVSNIYPLLLSHYRVHDVCIHIHLLSSIVIYIFQQNVTL
ncbi:hypothetical protein EON65_31035 [archaeon]|nr:MAG: hypothetical protein EON65_31035 [archaeon]